MDLATSLGVLGAYFTFLVFDFLEYQMVATAIEALRSALAQQDQDELDLLIIAYMDGYDKGKKDALAQQGEQQRAIGGPGEVLGAPHPDWPEWCETFSERKAYQQGVADARAIAAQTAQQDTWTDDGGWTFPVERQIIQTR